MDRVIKKSNCCNAEVILYRGETARNGQPGISYDQCSKCKRALGPGDIVKNPEPKPKDRIEEMGDTLKEVLKTDREYGNTDNIWEILEFLAEEIDKRQIIQRINERG